MGSVCITWQYFKALIIDFLDLTVILLLALPKVRFVRHL